MSQDSDIAQLMIELNGMPERKLLLTLKRLDTSRYIFVRNFEELQEFIRFLTSDSGADSILPLRNSAVLERALTELIRLLHNFAAAAKSLIDHTRKLHENLYGPEGLFPDYQVTVDREFASDPLSKFVEGLRGHLQHFRPPDISYEIRLPDMHGPESRTLLLSAQDLREDHRWSAPARRFLDEAGETIDILETLTRYRDKVVRFHEWVVSRQEEIHADEIQRVRAKEATAFLALLELKLNACLRDPNDMLHRGDEVFLHILSTEDFDELETLAPDSPARPARAIELVESRFPLPERVKKKILLLYQQPNLFARKD